MQMQKERIAELEDGITERDVIIDDLQATVRELERQVEAFAEHGSAQQEAMLRHQQARIAELEQQLANSQQIGNATAAALIALQDEYKALEVDHDNKGMGALALAEKRGQTITELVDEKIALRWQLEEVQAERDGYKAGWDAANAALKHTAEQVEQLHEQLSYAQATILKQAQRMAKLEADLYNLQAAAAKDAETEWMPTSEHHAAIKHLHQLACKVGHAFRMARIGETTDAERRNREALYAPYETLAKAIDALADGAPEENPITERMATLEALVGDLASDDECQLDSKGHCQTHGWFDTEMACPHGRAKAMRLGE